MHFLTTDKQECQDCGMCEILLKGFRSKYDGNLPLSVWALKDAELGYRIGLVIQFCPESAVYIEGTTMHRVAADPLKCGRGCTEPCVAAYPLFGVWGKVAMVIKDDPEFAEIWTGLCKAKEACERHAIRFEVMR